jgi:hypothetical protein
MQIALVFKVYPLVSSTNVKKLIYLHIFAHLCKRNAKPAHLCAHPQHFWLAKVKKKFPEEKCAPQAGIKPAIQPNSLFSTANKRSNRIVTTLKHSSVHSNK